MGERLGTDWRINNVIALDSIPILGEGRSYIYHGNKQRRKMSMKRLNSVYRWLFNTTYQ
jgi:hypothetical protein